MHPNSNDNFYAFTEVLFSIQFTYLADISAMIKVHFLLSTSDQRYILQYGELGI